MDVTDYFQIINALVISENNRSSIQHDLFLEKRTLSSVEYMCQPQSLQTIISEQNFRLEIEDKLVRRVSQGWQFLCVTGIVMQELSLLLQDRLFWLTPTCQFNIMILRTKGIQQWCTKFIHTYKRQSLGTAAGESWGNIVP